MSEKSCHIVKYFKGPTTELEITTSKIPNSKWGRERGEKEGRVERGG